MSKTITSEEVSEFTESWQFKISACKINISDYPHVKSIVAIFYLFFVVCDALHALC